MKSQKSDSRRRPAVLGLRRGGSARRLLFLRRRHREALPLVDVRDAVALVVVGAEVGGNANHRKLGHGGERLEMGEIKFHFMLQSKIHILALEPAVAFGGYLNKQDDRHSAKFSHQRRSSLTTAPSPGRKSPPTP